MNLQLPNGVRYPRVGETGQRRFVGTSFEPKKRLENAQTPTRRVHAVLGALTSQRIHCHKKTFSSFSKIDTASLVSSKQQLYVFGEPEVPQE
jgi:hypothetical protein